MIKLVNLLTERHISEDMIKQLAIDMGETIVDLLGTGANGTAYETESGRVLKFTRDRAEVALASRLRTKRLYKHIVNVYDVRPIQDSLGAHLILLDKVDPLDEYPNLARQWDYIKKRYFDKRVTDAEFMKWIAEQKHMSFDMNFINKLVAQRHGVNRDFTELRIYSMEAHSGNVGWNRHGNLVHFDAWQENHYSKTQYYQNKQKAKPDDIIWPSSYEINNEPYKKGISKSLNPRKD
jgi:hypothetical protein